MTQTHTTTATQHAGGHDSARRFQDALHELGRAGKDAAGEMIGAARRTASDRLERGKKRVTVARDHVAGYIQENPLKSLLIATAAGAMLGAILARRR